MCYQTIAAKPSFFHPNPPAGFVQLQQLFEFRTAESGTDTFQPVADARRAETNESARPAEGRGQGMPPGLRREDESCARELLAKLAQRHLRELV